MELKDYKQLLKAHIQNDYNTVVHSLITTLISAWINDYREMTNGENEILEFHDRGFSFLFDISGDNPSTTFVHEITKEQRVVAAYGITGNNLEKRNKSRMQAFIGGFESIPHYKGFDKGHLISHKIGGMLEQNLFPQKKEVNRGWSEDGKRYRKIERFCERNEGLFMFSRPLYNNPSWIPFAVEIGYLTKNFDFVIERVSN